MKSIPRRPRSLSNPVLSLLNQGSYLAQVCFDILSQLTFSFDPLLPLLFYPQPPVHLLLPVNSPKCPSFPTIISLPSTARSLRPSAFPFPPAPFPLALSLVSSTIPPRSTHTQSSDLFAPYNGLALSPTL